MKIPFNEILYLFSLSMLFLGSCIGERQVEDHPQQDSVQSVLDTSGDTSATLSWVYDAAADSIVQHEGTRKLDMHEKITVLNRRYGRIKLELVKQEGDTVFVKIDSAQYLVSQMGSSGAYGYMAETTYALTDASGAQWVNFDFEEGDHASPGVYGRSNFGGQ